MKKNGCSWLAISLVLIFAWGYGAISLTQLKSPREFQKGISFTGYSRNAYTGWAAQESLNRLKRTNAGWISLLVTAYQENINSTMIDYYGYNTPSDESLRAIIQHAHQLGLRVMLKPHVDLLNDTNHWRGQIGLNFSEADWLQWFASYRQFILHYAEMARDCGVEQFCIGCELDGTVKRVADWREIIREIRMVYNGRLVYADDQLESNPEVVQFWDGLDYIGQDLYPTLTGSVNPSVSELCQGWEKLLPKLKRLSDKWGKKVIVTEIGYRSVRGGAQNPWDWQKTGPVDLVVQRKCYEAALRMLAGRSYITGIFWWQWFPDLSIGGPKDTSYTPLGKPAEKVLTLRFLLPM